MPLELSPSVTTCPQKLSRPRMDTVAEIPRGLESSFRDVDQGAHMPFGKEREVKWAGDPAEKSVDPMLEVPCGFTHDPCTVGHRPRSYESMPFRELLAEVAAAYSRLERENDWLRSEDLRPLPWPGAPVGQQWREAGLPVHPEMPRDVTASSPSRCQVQDMKPVDAKTDTSDCYFHTAVLRSNQNCVAEADDRVNLLPAVASIIPEISDTYGVVPASSSDPGSGVLHKRRSQIIESGSRQTAEEVAVADVDVQLVKLTATAEPRDDPIKKQTAKQGASKPESASPSSGRRRSKLSDDSGHTRMSALSLLHLGEEHEQWLPPLPPRPRQQSECELVWQFRMFCHHLLVWTGFDAIVAACIVADAIILGIQAQCETQPDYVAGDMDVYSNISLAIKVLFIIELSMRYYVYGMWGSLRTSAWIRFDSLLVLCAIADIIGEFGNFGDGSPTTILRIFRLARLARSVRLVVEFRTLWLLVSGLYAALTTMLWTTVLIFSISYIFAVFAMQVITPADLVAKSEADAVALQQFGSLGHAMLTMLQVLTWDSIASIYTPLILQKSFSMGIVCAFFFILYILTVSVALMNLVTAILVESSLKQAAEDKEALHVLEEKRRKSLLPKLHNMFAQLDEDGSGEIAWDEFDKAPDGLKESLKALSKVDDLQEIFFLIDDNDDGVVVIDEFLEGVLKFSSSTGDAAVKLQLAKLVRQVGIMKNEFENLFIRHTASVTNHAHSSRPVAALHDTDYSGLSTLAS